MLLRNKRLVDKGPYVGHPYEVHIKHLRQRDTVLATLK